MKRMRAWTERKAAKSQNRGSAEMWVWRKVKVVAFFMGRCSGVLGFFKLWRSDEDDEEVGLLEQAGSIFFGTWRWERRGNVSKYGS